MSPGTEGRKGSCGIKHSMFSMFFFPLILCIHLVNSGHNFSEFPNFLGPFFPYVLRILFCRLIDPRNPNRKIFQTLDAWILFSNLTNWKEKGWVWI